MRNKNTRLVLHRGILESSHQMQHWNEAHRLGATGKDIHWINMYLILCFDRLRRSLAVHTTFCSSVGSQGRWSWSLHQNYSVQHFAPANVTQFIVVHLITFTVEEETYNQQQKKIQIKISGIVHFCKPCFFRVISTFMSHTTDLGWL